MCVLPLAVDNTYTRDIVKAALFVSLLALGFSTSVSAQEVLKLVCQPQFESYIDDTNKSKDYDNRSVSGRGTFDVTVDLTKRTCEMLVTECQIFSTSISFRRQPISRSRLGEYIQIDRRTGAYTGTDVYKPNDLGGSYDTQGVCTKAPSNAF